MSLTITRSCLNSLYSDGLHHARNVQPKKRKRRALEKSLRSIDGPEERCPCIVIVVEGSGFGTPNSATSKLKSEQRPRDIDDSVQIRLYCKKAISFKRLTDNQSRLRLAHLRTRVAFPLGTLLSQ